MRTQKNAGEERRKIIAVTMVLAFAGMAKADTVQLDLFSIGCQTEFAFDSPPYWWSSDFDLGVTFSQIDHVYIDWAGGITAGRAIRFSDPCNPFPMGVGIYASLGSNPYLRSTEIYGGMDTYPDPESFDQLSEVKLTGNSTWADLLDGQGTIGIGYTEIIMLNGKYIEHGLVTLNKATLVIDGVVVPEPASLLFLITGTLGLRLRRGRS